MVKIWDESPAPPIVTGLAGATAAKYSKPNIYRGVLARFPRAIRELARVSEYGTNKHQVPLEDVSFTDIPGAEVMYKEALCRHIIDEAISGPINTDDGGLLHCLQRAWDALADAEVYLKRKEQEGG